ncbi:MAG TPA: DNA/RNA non-specific endonuclease [Tepidisphaeraceae bacterium]|jgi:endonuclease G
MGRRRRSNGLDERDVQRATRAFLSLDARLQLIVIAILVVGGIVYWISRTRTQQPGQPPAREGTVARSQQPPTASPAASEQLLLGNPSGATHDLGSRSNYLMLKPYYALSYNDSLGTPNWVSWRVTKLDLGTAPRKQMFDPDITLPPGFYRVTHKDYSGSGYDRGHLCPHSDRAATDEMSFATFVMTNIIPQAPNVNQKGWADLEEYCRTLVKREHDRLYIVSGRAGSKGTIARGKVDVPAECWKVVVVVPEAGGEDDLAKINTSTRVISIRMPNEQDVSTNWKQYRVTPAEIEHATGYQFFDRVPAEIAQVLRQKMDR